MSDYEKHTIASKNPIKRWLHRQRFGASVQLLQPKPHQKFLDYGCGDGELALQMHFNRPDLEVIAFDPATELFEQAIKKLSPFPNITVTQHFSPDMGKFGRIACLETIEHLPENELHELFDNIKSVLKEDGFCLFTFPIEHGFISLLKNCYRMVTGRDKYASIGRTFRRLLGLPVQREPQEKLSECNYIYSHIGFDCRKMIEKIRQHFVITKIHVLPMGYISFGLGNSIAVIAKKSVTTGKAGSLGKAPRRGY